MSCVYISSGAASTAGCSGATSAAQRTPLACLWIRASAGVGSLHRSLSSASGSNNCRHTSCQSGSPGRVDAAVVGSSAAAAIVGSAIGAAGAATSVTTFFSALLLKLGMWASRFGGGDRLSNLASSRSASATLSRRTWLRLVLMVEVPWRSSCKKSAACACCSMAAQASTRVPCSNRFAICVSCIASARSMRCSLRSVRMTAAKTAPCSAASRTAEDSS